MTTSSFLTLLRSSRLGKQDSPYNAALLCLCKSAGLMTQAGLPPATQQCMPQKELFLQPVASQGTYSTTAVRHQQTGYRLEAHQYCCASSEYQLSGSYDACCNFWQRRHKDTIKHFHSNISQPARDCQVCSAGGRMVESTWRIPPTTCNEPYTLQIYPRCSVSMLQVRFILVQ